MSKERIVRTNIHKTKRRPPAERIYPTSGVERLWLSSPGGAAIHACPDIKVACARSNRIEQGRRRTTGMRNRRNDTQRARMV
jgi:hypothetical protein